MRYLLGFYYLGILIFGVFAAIAIHQFSHYKIPGDRSHIATIVFLAISGIIILYSFGSILTLDWT